MIKYIIKRLLYMIPVMFIISIIMFVVVKLTPGDPTSMKIGPQVTEEQRQEMAERLGYDKPIIEQYGMWLGNVMKLDFGESYTYKRPVGEVMGTYIKNSIILNIPVLILIYLVGVPLGMYVAVKKGKFADRLVTVVSFAGMSFPVFFLALVFIYVFAVSNQWLPISGMVSPGMNYTGLEYVIDVGKHLVLPVLTIITLNIPGMTRFVRMTMLNSINEDYVRTARAKGVKERKVIYSHAFRNSLINIVTMLSGLIGSLIGGSLFTETVFNWPGIGRVMYDSVTMRDYNLMMASMLFFTAIGLLSNLIADICYCLVDPRVKVS